jgi:NAD(P)-dependent dehydrogenase (short-subunit alcohol dehydrogenase family)
MTISSRIALVTGGSRGLGRSTVLSLANRGVHSIFTYHSNREEAGSVTALVQQAGAKAVALQLDTGNVATFDAFVGSVRQALQQLGASSLDYLVNNAGNSNHNLIVNTSEAEVDALYNVHFKGVYFLTQKVLPVIKDGGRIVNLSSGLTRFSMPGMAAYASMKGAIEVLTRYLATELGARGITVNTVAPGAIATDFGNSRVRDNPEVKRQIASGTALGRVGVAEDIGPMIASLLSDENRWVNGQRIEVSGGVFL